MKTIKNSIICAALLGAIAFGGSAVQAQTVYSKENLQQTYDLAPVSCSS